MTFEDRLFGLEKIGIPFVRKAIPVEESLKWKVLLYKTVQDNSLCFIYDQGKLAIVYNSVIIFKAID